MDWLELPAVEAEVGIHPGEVHILRTGVPAKK